MSIRESTMNQRTPFSVPADHKKLTFLMSALALAFTTSAARSSEPENLPVVVVSATRHAMALADAPAAISVVTAAQIEQRGADNVLEALRGETGVSLFGRTISGRKTISLRGMDARHTLFLVDGRRIGASDGVIGHSDFQLDWIAVDDIERIEVLRGPLSVLYGAEAMGGVVQIFTRGVGTTLQANARLEGSWADGGRGGDGHRATARITAPLTTSLGFTLTLGDSRRGSVASSTDPRISALEARHKQDAALRLQWRLSTAQQIELEHRSGHEERDALMVERSGKKRVFVSDTTVSRSHSALSWLADWGGEHELRSTLRAYESHITMKNWRSKAVTALNPNALRDRVLELQGSGRNGAQLLTAGAELREEHLDNRGLPGGGASISHRALFMQDEIDVGQALTMTAGLRHDDHERFGAKLSPRLYAVWRTAPGWTLKGGYSTGFKPPTLKQITPGFAEDEGPYTYVSNPALRPESNRSAELGLAWDSHQSGVQAMLFENRVEDLVLATLIGNTGTRQTLRFDNVEHARLRGIELGGRHSLGAGLSLQLNYQYLDACDGAGLRLEKRPRHSLGASLDWVRGAWRASLRADHSAGMVLATGVAGQVPQPVPDITVAGFSVGYAISRMLDLDLSASNLGNLDLAQRSALYTWSEAPRTWRLSLRARF
ncbi:MAG: hypothetical protein C0423_16410 [Methylibium sp.]|nr:hypothetical protein [Methylibium sp.]